MKKEALSQLGYKDLSQVQDTNAGQFIEKHKNGNSK